MVVFYKIWKKENKIQLTKNKMEFNNRKMINHPPFPYVQMENSTALARCGKEVSYTSAASCTNGELHSPCKVWERG